MVKSHFRSAPSRKVLRASVVVAFCVFVGIAQAAGPLDGQYSGTRTDLTNGDGSLCGKTGPFSLTVTDNQFEYTYNRQLQVVLRPTIAADGSFSARQEYMLQRSSTTARIKGRIDAGTLVAEVEGQRCQYRLELKKR